LEGKVHWFAIMKLRHIALIVLFVGGFWYLTSHLPSRLKDLPFVSSLRSSKSPLQLTEADAAPAYDAEEQNNIAVYKRVLPSVVNITSRQVVFNFFYGAVPQEGQGSGFILDRAGHVLTNNHVIEGANRGIDVHAEQQASLCGQGDRHRQSARSGALQIDAPNLEPVTLADSSELAVGQKVYAIGNPFGLNGTMTRGIISSIRSWVQTAGAHIEDAIQTDAAINPGNSGGPLLNSRGEVIGINTMIASNGAEQSSGIGFAIPINTAKAVLADLTRYGRVKRPSLGIVSYAIGPDLAQQMGLGAEYGVLIQQCDSRGCGGAGRAAWRHAKKPTSGIPVSFLVET
jgi:S1-C subfamily serine protease